MYDSRLENARLVVLSILQGHVPEDEDVCSFNVLRVDADDPEWLLGQLGNQSWPLAARVEVLYYTGSVFPRALELLRAEDPDLGSIKPPKYDRDSQP